MDLDTTVGIDALKIFHNRSAQFSNYTISWDEFKAHYGSKFLIYAEGVGLVINVNQMGAAQVRAAMEALADQGQGRLPADAQAFQRALGNEAGRIDWVDLTKEVATGTALEVAGGLQAFGDSLISTLGALNWIFPFVIVLGLLWVSYRKILKVAG